MNKTKHHVENLQHLLHGCLILDLNNSTQYAYMLGITGVVVNYCHLWDFSLRNHQREIFKVKYFSFYPMPFTAKGPFQK